MTGVMAPADVGNPAGREAVPALADILDRLVPTGARAILEDGLAALVWMEDDEGPFALFARGGDEGRFAVLHPAPFDLDVISPMLRGDTDLPRQPRTIVGLLWGSDECEGDGVPDPARRDALVAFAASVDAEAYVALQLAQFQSYEMLRLLDRRAPMSREAHAFLREYPSLLDHRGLSAMHPDEARAALSKGPTGLAEALLAESGLSPGEARRHAGRLKGMTTGFVRDHMRTPSFHRGQARMPDRLWPAPGDEAGIAAAMQGAFLVDPLVQVSGRTWESVIGRTGGLPRALAAAARKLEQPPYDQADPAAVREVAYLMGILFQDAVHSFSKEVVLPAMRLTGIDEDGVPDDHFSVADCPDHPVTAAALRLLLGEGTLTSLAETCNRWHTRVSLIEEAVAGMAEGLHDGPPLFADRDLGGGVYLTCLNTLGALADEGSPRDDANGAPGLGHCVASYGLDVISRERCVVGLRRRLPDGGYERLSTAEVRFANWHDEPIKPEVRQHYGQANAPVPAWLDEALARGLAEVAEDAQASLARHREAYRTRSGRRTSSPTRRVGAGYATYGASP